VSDAAGQFTLSGVPRDAGRVLAGHGAGFGAATPAATGNLPLVIRLKPSPAEGGPDVAKAETVLRAIQQRVKASHVENPMGGGLAWAIAADAPDLALQLAQKENDPNANDDALATIIQQITEKAPARIDGWAIPHLNTIQDAAKRRAASYAIATAAHYSADPSFLRSLYADMKAQPTPGEDWRALLNNASLACLAALLGQAEDATAWTDKALAIAREKPELYAMLTRALVPGGGSLVQRALTHVPVKDRSDTAMRTLSDLARRSPVSAAELLDAVQQDPEIGKGDRDDYNLSRTTLEVIRELAPSDPARAARLTDRVTYQNFQAAALALAAHGQRSAAEAAPLYDRAASAAMGNPIVLGAIARLARDNAPKVSVALFAEGRRRLSEIAADNASYRMYATVGFAYQYAPIAPGVSRVLLEQALAGWKELHAEREDTSGNDRAQVALAFRPLDIDRAIALSDQVPEHQAGGSFDIRNDTQIEIAHYLLADPATRRTLPLNRFDQYGFQPSNY